MNFEQYRREVVARALKTLKREKIYKVCTDTIRESFYRGLPIKDATEAAVSDTIFWEKR